MFTGETFFVTSCLLPALPLKKGIKSKRKEFVPERANSFPLEQTPFGKVEENAFDRVAFFGSVFIPLNQTSFQMFFQSVFPVMSRNSTLAQKCPQNV